MYVATLYEHEELEKLGASYSYSYSYWMNMVLQVWWLSRITQWPRKWSRYWWCHQNQRTSK